MKPKNKAIESLRAAMADRLLGEKPLTMAYGESVIAEVTNYIETLEKKYEALLVNKRDVENEMASDMRRNMSGFKVIDECLICGYRGDFYECPRCEIARPIDKIVCQWSVEFAVPLTEEQLNTLVNRLADAQLSKNNAT